MLSPSKQRRLRQIALLVPSTSAVVECSPRPIFDVPGSSLDSAATSSGSGISCGECSWLGTTVPAVRDHTRTHHPSRRHFCPLLTCSRSFVRREYLVKHFLTHGVNDRYECRVCDRRFGQLGTLKRHARTRHRECCEGKGDLSTFDVHFTKEHMAQHSYECMLCQLAFPCATTFGDHIHQHGGEEDLAKDLLSTKSARNCTVCSLKFAEQPDLVEHMTNLHPDNQVQFMCHRCGMILIDGVAHETHKQECLPPVSSILSPTTPWETSNAKTQYACPSCPASFDAPHKLRAHMATHEISLGGHNCRMCDVVCNSKGELDVHVQTVHTAELPYPCTQCNRRFATTRHLHRHGATHNKRHRCTKCDQRFAHSNELARHMQRHSTQANHTCPYCLKSYKYGSSVKSHIRMAHVLPSLDIMKTEHSSDYRTE